MKTVKQTFIFIIIILMILDIKGLDEGSHSQHHQYQSQLHHYQQQHTIKQQNHNMKYSKPNRNVARRLDLLELAHISQFSLDFIIDGVPVTESPTTSPQIESSNSVLHSTSINSIVELTSFLSTEFPPTAAPSAENEYSSQPTQASTTGAPSSTTHHTTHAPTTYPSTNPSFLISETPTEYPSFESSEVFTASPTESPSEQALDVPSLMPTEPPTDFPTIEPSVEVTFFPTEDFPSYLPSRLPTRIPTTVTHQPSELPMIIPTTVPTLESAGMPSTTPSWRPTSSPSFSSIVPTTVPTLASSSPTAQSQNGPSVVPTTTPTLLHSHGPSNIPTCFPSSKPSTSIPSPFPSQHIANEPTIQPTYSTSLPTASSITEAPNISPSGEPTISPSIPSTQPSTHQTEHPTLDIVIFIPTETPTIYPSVTPTFDFKLRSDSPTDEPTPSPSTIPTAQPTIIPTSMFSATPISLHPTPSLMISKAPTLTPSTNPLAPTISPTARSPFVPSSPTPTTLPTHFPSFHPTIHPSYLAPTKRPWSRPSSQPTSQPSKQPTRQPTVCPSSSQPSARPTTRQPSSTPSVIPTIPFMRSPTFFPSLSPSLPSSYPTTQPSLLQLTQLPTYTPTNHPQSLSGYPTFNDVSAKPSTVAPCAPTSMPSFYASILPTSKLSVKPSFVPTQIPTNNLSPLPVLSNLIIFAGKTNATVKVTLSPNGTKSGNVFCLPSRTAIASASIVTEYGFYANYFPATSEVAIVIQDLLPATNYTVYCAARSYDGSVSPLSQILRSSKQFYTNCCKSLMLSTRVAYLLNNPVVYSTTSFAATNIFKYYFMDDLEDIVVIKPYLANLNGTEIGNSLWKISPPSMTFMSYNSSMGGSFAIIVTKDLPAGFYQVVVPVYSASNGIETQYSSTSATFEVIEASSDNVIVLPPPNLYSVKFADTGSTVYVTFDSPTNKAGISEPKWTCSRVLSFPGSNQAICTWLNSTVVLVSLNRIGVSGGRRLAETSQLVVGETFTIVPRILAAECISTSLVYVNCSAFQYAADAKPILPPSNPVKPVPIVVVPSKIPHCVPFSIDPTLSYGDGGKDFVNVSWTVKMDSTTVTHLENLLNTNRLLVTTIPNDENLLQGTYHVTLSLTNIFGMTQETTVSFFYGSEQYTPSIKILGSRTLKLKLSDPLTIYSDVTVPLFYCNESNIGGNALIKHLAISWRVYNKDVDKITGVPSLKLTNITSFSLNSRIFSLPGFQFPREGDYVIEIYTVAKIDDGNSSADLVEVEATSSIDVVLSAGNVIASISGGSTRSITTDITLDASLSYDERNRTAKLSFAWSCLIASPDSYGLSCDDIFDFRKEYGKSKIGVRADLLTKNKLYQVYVIVASNSRTGTTFVNLRGGLPLKGNHSVNIETSATHFNGQGELAIEAYIQSNIPVVAVWSATSATSSSLVLSENDTTTELARSFSPSSQFINFPLNIFAHAFNSYSKVSFRISLFAANDFLNVLAYSEISLKVNSGPYGGLVRVSPAEGVALQTIFTMATVGWVDGADESLPLTFEFQYIPGFDEIDSLIIQQRSTALSASSELPIGKSADHRIYIVVRAFDSFLASGNASQDIVVFPNSAVDSVDYFSQQMAKGQWDTNKQYVTANNALSMLNKIDCSQATMEICSALNRENCSIIRNTCGKCLSGYFSNMKEPNTPCHRWKNQTAEVLIGSACSRDDDCLNAICSSGTCGTPLKFCAANCSGKGECQFFVGGRIVPPKDCPISNPYCQAKCSCLTGYGGFACEYSAHEIVEKRNTLTTICGLLQQVMSNSDLSPQFMENIAQSVFLASRSLSVTSHILSMNDTCLNLIGGLSEIVKSGYLKDAPNEEKTSQQLISTLSNFINSLSSRLLSTPELISYFEDVLSNLVDGRFIAMVNGESRKDYAAENIAISFYRSFIDSTQSSVTLQTPLPLTSFKVDDKFPVPKISFVENAFQHCDSGDGYAKFAFSQWVSIPNLNTSRTDSPKIRSGAYVAKKLSGNIPITNQSKVAFYIELPYSVKQNIMNNPILPTKMSEILIFSNYTITQPQCVTFESIGEETTSLLCNNCTISSFTNESAVFACYDIGMLCGIRDSISQHRTLKRGLLSLENSDVASESKEFSVILNEVAVEVDTLLTKSPFEINMQNSKVIVSLAGTICSMIIFGMLFFNNWDWQDHHRLMYGHGCGDFFGDLKENKSLTEVSNSGVKEMRSWDSKEVTQSDDMKSHDTVFEEGNALYEKVNGHCNTNFKHRSLLLSRETNSRIEKKQLKKKNKSQRTQSTKLLQDALINGERLEWNEGELSAVDDEIEVESFAQHDFSNANTNVKDLNHSEFQMITNFLDLVIPMFQSDVLSSHHKQEDFLDDKKRKSYNSVITVSSSSTASSLSMLSRLWVAMISTMSPFWQRYWGTVWSRHLLTKMFSEASLSYTRLIRWIHLMLMILLILFVDTLFFEIVFPDKGYCESQNSKSECLSSINYIIGENLCKWEESVTWSPSPAINTPTLSHVAEISTSCTLVKPPITITFLLLLAICCIIVNAPLAAFYEFVLLEICSKRPNLSMFGLHTGEWFGSELLDVQQYREQRDEIHISEFEKMLFGNYGYDNADLVDMPEDEFLARTNDVTASYFQPPSTPLSIPPQSPFSAGGSYIGNSTSGYVLQEHDYITRMIYANYLTPEDETNMLIREMRQYIYRYVHRMSMPWRSAASIPGATYGEEPQMQPPTQDCTESDASASARPPSPSRVSFSPSMSGGPSVSSSTAPFSAWKNPALLELKMNVIQELLGIQIDTTPRSMTVLDRMWYKTPRQRLEYKIRSARSNASKIESALWSIQDRSGFERSIVLVRYFLLEMFSPFKQYVIKSQYFPYQSFSKETISLRLWVCGWCFVLGSMGFFLYWIISWAVASGSNTFVSWGWNFLLIGVQEIVLIPFIQIYIIYFMAMNSIEPQLRCIFNRLQKISIDIVTNTKEQMKKEEEQMQLHLLQQQELLLQQQQHLLMLQQQGMYDPLSPIAELAPSQILSPPPALSNCRSSPVAGYSDSPTMSSTSSCSSVPSSPKVVVIGCNTDPSSAASRAAELYEDTIVLQYMSPACRVANRSVMKDLPGAKVLRHLTDSDLIEFKKDSDKPLSFISMLVLGLPVIVSSTINERFGLMVVHVTFPVVLYLSIIGHYYFYQFSYALMILVYIGIVAITAFWYLVYKPAISRMEKQRVDIFESIERPIIMHRKSDDGHSSTVERCKEQQSLLSLRRYFHCVTASHSSDDNHKISLCSRVIWMFGFMGAVMWASSVFIYTSIQYCVVIAPCRFYRSLFWTQSDYHYNSRTEANIVWKTMNFPSILQGYEVSKKEINRRRKQLEEFTSGMQFPQDVQELRTMVKTNMKLAAALKKPSKSSPLKPSVVAASVGGWPIYYCKRYGDCLSTYLSKELLSNPSRQENPIESLMWLRESPAAGMIAGISSGNNDTKFQNRQTTIIAPKMELHDIVVDLKIASIDKNMSLNDGALLIDDPSGSKRVSARFSHRIGTEAPVVVEEIQPEDYSYTENARQAWNFTVYSRYGLHIPSEVTVTEAKEILVELLRIFRPCHLPIAEEDQYKVIHRFERRLPKDENISPDMMTLNTERFELWFLGQAKSLRNKIAIENDIATGGGIGGALPPLVI